MASPLSPARSLRRLGVAAALAVATGCAAESSPNAPKGVVVVVVDCLRADQLAAYGAKIRAAPRLDELAAAGVVFGDAFSVGSWTRPSLPSLFTGLYPAEHGLSEPFLQRGRSLVQRRLPPEAVTIAEAFRDAGFRTAMIGEQPLLAREFQLDQGFEEYRHREGSAAAIRKRFLDWLQDDPGAPFFAYLHLLELHWPYCPQSTFGAFDPTPGSPSLCIGEKQNRKIDRRIDPGSEADVRALRARYSEELLELDGEIGALFDALRARSLWEETLVVVTSDHGEELLEHGSFRHGHTLYDELLRVPLVFKPPSSWRIAPGARVEGPVENRSLAPTLFELAGRAVPPDVSAPSLVPWLLGRAPAHPPAEVAIAQSSGLYSVRKGGWKLITSNRGRHFELFDLAADPAERENLAASHPERVAEMKALLRQWRAQLRPLPAAKASPLEAETTEGLRALGYLR